MSDFRISLRKQAERDIDEAVAHYIEEAGAEIAVGFIDELETAFRQLSTHPAMGSPRYAVELDLPGLRSWPLRRFPYLVFYLERDADLDVWRVLHGQRDIPPSLQSA